MPISMPQISFGKTKEKSQMAFVSTTDGRCLVEETPVTANCVVSDKHACSFIPEETEQYQGKDGHFYQLFSDKSALPLMPLSETEKRQKLEKQFQSTIDDICDLTEDMKIHEQFMNAKKNDRGDVIKWVVSCVMGAFVIIAGMQFLWG